MLFDTPVYFLFLTLVVIAYWRLPFRGQNLLLLACSYFFYGWWDWRFLFLMGLSTVVDYYLALKIARTGEPTKRRVYLIISLVMNFGFLGFFKYFNFFIDSFHHVAALFGSGNRLRFYLSIILPAGISFYTFQAVAYIVDVYFKKLKPVENLVDYALFISFFPHLVAGPIQRPGHLLPQVQNARSFDSRQFFDGLMLILTGLFRKCVIADNCALLANAAFGGKLGKPDLFVLLLGAYAFAWQIYGDFSGYSDIARGSAQLLGFHFVVNFRQPYLAVGFSDFWRRWHISLSTWLRDYLYIPLGGNRRGERRTYGNLFTTMLLGGLWHGANWTFVLWGGLHGAALAVERALGFKGDGQDGSTGGSGQYHHSQAKTAGRDAPALWQAGRPPIREMETGAQGSRSSASQASPTSFWRIWGKRLVIFHLVCLLWILFRASSIGAAWEMLRGAAHLSWSSLYLTSFGFLAIFSLPLFLLDLRLEKHDEEYPFQGCWQVQPWRSYACRATFGALLLGLTVLMAASESNAFIYFQF